MPTPLMAHLAETIIALRSPHVVKVAVDGFDGVGKTTFADALGQAIGAAGRPVIRASIDGFHNSREQRYARGRESPEGFYRDSYDLAGLKRDLLDPLAPNGSGRYRTLIFDHTTDRPAPSPMREAEPGAILIFDGLFLHRPELRPYWDLSILPDAPFTITIPRGASRGPGFGSPDPLAPSNRRYIGGQILYVEECDPRGRASVVIDHSDFRTPVIATWRI